MVAFVSALSLLLGTLHGTVMRGPTMPVCRIDQPCEKPAAHVTLSFARGGLHTSTVTDANGRYKIKLAPGSYTVTTNQKPFGFRPQPSTVRVVARRDLRVDFSIDTGIR